MRWNPKIFKHITVWKYKDTVIVNFKCRKQKLSILINRKNFFKCRKWKLSILVNKKFLINQMYVPTQLNFSSRLFVSETMCHKNHQLCCKCRQLKNTCKIHSIWFWNNSVNFKLNKKVNLERFIILLILNNFLELAVQTNL